MTQNYIRQIEFIRQTNYFNFEVTMFEFTKDLSFFSIPNIHVSKTSVFHRTGNMGTLLPKKLRKSKLCTYILLFLLLSFFTMKLIFMKRNYIGQIVIQIFIVTKTFCSVKHFWINPNFEVPVFEFVFGSHKHACF